MPVRDTGVGIAPELLPCIFDLFTQAKRSLDRSQGGLGIGLSLVQQLVKLHGGTVEVHSVLLQGSEFVVRLPIMPDSALPLSLPSSETAASLGKYCRVLVVDDNVYAAHMLAMLLKMSGHEVRIAYDGANHASELEAALAFRPDVMLLDIGLPGLSGLEVAQRIRQQPALDGWCSSRSPAMDTRRTNAVQKKRGSITIWSSPPILTRCRKYWQAFERLGALAPIMVPRRMVRQPPSESAHDPR